MRAPLAVTCLAAAALALLPACSSSVTRADIMNSWAGALAEAGMTPVVPVSEDIRVGDMFAFDADPDTPELLGLFGRSQTQLLGVGSRWDAVNVLDAVDAEYRARPGLPRTPVSYFDPSRRDFVEEPTADPRELDESNLATIRLREVASNVLGGMNFTAKDVGALLPAEVLNVVTSDAWAQKKAVTMQVSSASTYSVSMNELIDLLIETEADGTRRLKDEYRKNLALVAKPGSRTVWLRVVSEVLYARSIDIAIQSRFGKDPYVVNPEHVAAAIESKDSAKPATATPPPPASSSAPTEAKPAGATTDDAKPAAEAPASSTAPPAAPATPAQSAPAGPEPKVQAAATVLDPTYRSFSRADGINALLISSNLDQTPGSAIRFLNMTSSSVTMRRTYTRPLAIGVRGLELAVDVETGEIRSSRQMGP